MLTAANNASKNTADFEWEKLTQNLLYRSAEQQHMRYNKNESGPCRGTNVFW